jgi:hypothetical protein
VSRVGFSATQVVATLITGWRPAALEERRQRTPAAVRLTLSQALQRQPPQLDGQFARWSLTLVTRPSGAPRVRNMRETGAHCPKASA